ncbi:mannitol dehydrogenase family protein [Rhabdaerophilum calidifontis]|uniref:mannitol dehydrogenase family protein n=1 Tax=Rhabdaerophilum calidifontis TaxID=2604328 RepID=UPI001239BE8B|nr:mannitol dehydrogenase family protein [Rhabdaerophilum calidifontis]
MPTLPRLAAATLPKLPAPVRRPGYDWTAAAIGIVHLGLGAFHRAHQAAMIEDCLERGESGWAIAGASLRSPETRDALAPQDGLYTLAVRGPGGEALRVIGAIRESLVAPEDPARLLARMARPETRIVSLTVTEKGYCHDPASGTLNEAHPDILHDLAHPERPKSAIGLLAAALRMRRMAGLRPFTVLTCDNLPANGRTVKRVIDRFAALLDADFGHWVADQVACPASMVDRIVPATTDEDRARISAALGMEDRWPVVTEPFSQWVVEDHFPLGRPDLAASGAEMVADVTPFEHMKLRLLNGSHSTLAYLGYLAGYETIAETMADPAFARLVRRQMDADITPTLHMPPGHDLGAYKDRLIERFKNPALRHRTWQIAMDGSQKLPQRLLGMIRERLAAGAPVERPALAVAGWMRYVAGIDEAGRPIDIRDPLASRFAEIVARTGPNPETLGRALLGMPEIFGVDLPADPRFTGPVLAALAALFRDSARATVAAAA